MLVASSELRRFGDTPGACHHGTWASVRRTCHFAPGLVTSSCDQIAESESAMAIAGCSALHSRVLHQQKHWGVAVPSSSIAYSDQADTEGIFLWSGDVQIWHTSCEHLQGEEPTGMFSAYFFSVYFESEKNGAWRQHLALANACIACVTHYCSLRNTFWLLWLAPN